MMRSLILFLILTILINQSKQDQDKHQTQIFGANAKQFPFQVALYIYQNPPQYDKTMAKWCGGTLISNQYILTAAQCLTFPNSNQIKNSAIIYLGALNRNDAKEQGRRRIKVPSSNFIVHKYYDPVNNFNDIALVKLPAPILFDEYVKPAQLSVLRSPVNTTIISSGWGITSDSSSNLLQYMESQIISHDDCVNYYTEFVPASQVCISVPEKSFCNIDTGSPNVIRNGSGQHFHIIGISTLGCVEDWPQVSTLVPFYLDWITETANLETYP